MAASGVVIGRIGDKPLVVMEGHRLVVPDNAGLSVAELYAQHEIERDVKALGDSGLLDLKSAGLRPSDAYLFLVHAALSLQTSPARGGLIRKHAALLLRY